MAAVSLLLILQAEAVARLEAEDVEVREAAKAELLALGGMALPALRASGTLEARGVIERIYEQAERAFRESRAIPRGRCGETDFLDEGESARWTRELEALFPGCRLRAARTQCMHRNLCGREGLWIYAVAEDDAEVFTIRHGRRLDDALLRRLAPVPGREAETARLLQGGWARDVVEFDERGRALRVRRP